MKKTQLFLMCGLTLLMGACEAEYGYHYTGILVDKADSTATEKILYADQVSDSIHVKSLDPWNATIEAENNWFEISPWGSEARPGSKSETRVDLKFSQNDTDKNRIGKINVKSAYKDRELSLNVKQYKWLHITYPDQSLSNDSLFEDRTKRFELQLLNSDKTSTISFYVYQDNARLETNSPWVTPEQTLFQKGYHHVKLTFEPNASSLTREATLILTSGKVSTPIFVKQEGKKDNK